jgi:hypothetical protein
MLIAAGVTRRASAWRRISRSIADRARGLNQPSRSAAYGPPVRGREWTTISSIVGAADPLDPRATDDGRRTHDPQPVEIAAEPERGAVPQATACLEGSLLAGLLREMAAQPRLAVREERLDVAFGV